ncbi:hypothetical protein UO65_4483 [Actinokineospora spheciospongiae]|uniref:Uncharacterized protein n=1 Tax=Actinokineospora spheciospongiae TaxID=909613 RepID=W7IU14_9PSEU|nr:hypothetical protein UO65_4483 [Actinokineospora spheciospongiae]
MSDSSAQPPTTPPTAGHAEPRHPPACRAEPPDEPQAGHPGKDLGS